MIGIPYRDVYDTILMLRDVILMRRPHPPGCDSLLVETDLVGLRYVTGSPSGSVDTTRMDLLECGILYVI